LDTRWAVLEREPSVFERAQKFEMAAEREENSVEGKGKYVIILSVQKG